MTQRTPVDYQRLFKHAPSAFMVLDRELRYLAANDAYIAVVATPLDQLLGRPIFEVFPHDPLDPKNENQRRLRQSFESVFATGKVDTIATIVYRIPVQTPEGPVIQERYWSATHTPIFDEAGRVEAVLQHTEDVTELQRLRSNEPKSAASVLRRAEVVQGRNDALEMEREHLLSLFQQAPVFTASFARTRARHRARERGCT